MDYKKYSNDFLAPLSYLQFPLTMLYWCVWTKREGERKRVKKAKKKGRERVIRTNIFNFVADCDWVCAKAPMYFRIISIPITAYFFHCIVPSATYWISISIYFIIHFLIVYFIFVVFFSILNLYQYLSIPVWYSGLSHTHTNAKLYNAPMRCMVACACNNYLKLFSLMILFQSNGAIEKSGDCEKSMRPW